MPSKRALEAKEKLRRGEIVYSAWLTFNDVGVAEVLAGSGFDIVLIDTAHISITLENLHHCLAAMKAWDPVTIVRVPGHDPAGIKRVLDIGADGVIGPMTMDAEQCARLVASRRYAPAWRRGFGPRRASDHFRDIAGYVATADAATFVIPQIEHVEAAEQALSIASVPGIDARPRRGSPAARALRRGQPASLARRDQPARILLIVSCRPGDQFGTAE